MDFFNYDDEHREQTVNSLFAEAKTARLPLDNKWKILNNAYYSFRDSVDRWNAEVEKNFEEDGSNELKLTDPFIQVESQAEGTVYEPMFVGRDQEDDHQRAKQREYVVKYLIAKNDLQSAVMKNERNLRKYGDAFVKVYYDDSADFDNGGTGDIRIEFINTDDIFPDPAADKLDNCEYVDYVYYMHRRRAERVFAKELKRKGLDVWAIASESRGSTQSVSDSETGIESETYTIQVTEHWYRDDDGDIALSILLGDREIKHVAKYWARTGKQNKRYPFEHFRQIASESSFWSTSEIETILPLCEAANRVLNRGLQNFDFLSNDIIGVEEDALAEGEEFDNRPGAVIKFKAGRLRQGWTRLGGLNGIQNVISDMQYFQNEIQRTTRNYDTNMGKETAKVNTASGLAQLRADATAQTNKKDVDRKNGWRRLFQLIDWTALEFYDDDRLIFIGAPKAIRKQEDLLPLSRGGCNLDANKGDVYFRFNAQDMEEKRNERIVGLTEDGRPIIDFESYFPIVDCDVIATNGVEKSRSFTIQALQSLLGTQLTVENYKIAIMIVRELGIPQGEEIIGNWLEQFEPQQIPGIDPAVQAQLPLDIQQMARQNPMLVELAKQNISISGNTQTNAQRTYMPTQHINNAENPQVIA